MIEGEKTVTKVDLQTICGWISDVWVSIPTKMVKRSFLKTSISNNLDETEDNLIWEDSDDGKDDDDKVSSDRELWEIFKDSSDEEDFYGF